MKPAAASKENQTTLFENASAGAGGTPLWQLDIAELAGHNIETKGREEVNRLLSEGWVLLHIYTLRYEENGVWRERPMAILGRPRTPLRQHGDGKRDRSSSAGVSWQSPDSEG